MLNIELRHKKTLQIENMLHIVRKPKERKLRKQVLDTWSYNIRKNAN